MKQKPFFSVLLAATMAFAPVAKAAPRDEAGRAAIADAARARFNEGLRLYAKKKYSQAYAAFLQAYSLTKHPAILLNLGQTALRIGRPLDAAHDFQQFLNEAKTAPALQRTRAEKGLAAAREHLGSVTVSAPEGAEIAVDGVTVGRAPLDGPVDVVPGAHEVTMTTPDLKRAQTVRVLEGVEVTVKMAAAAGPSTSPKPRAVVEPTEPSPDGASDLPSSPPPAEGNDRGAGILSPPESMAPVVVAGTIGLVGLTTAIVLGGIRMNAERNRTTAGDALTRNGHDPAGCAGAAASDPTTGGACASLNSAQNTLDSTGGAYVGALLVGAGASVFALGWYLLAPKAGDAHKEPKEPSGLAVGPAHVNAFVAPGNARADVVVEF